MSGNSSFWRAFGISNAIATNRRNKNALKQVQQLNSQNRGIVHYSPSPVQAVFSAQDLAGNIALSGGDFGWRMRVIGRLCECAMISGYAPILLHGGNQALCIYLEQCLGAGNIVQINYANPVYDPFIGLTNEQINRLIFDACPKGSEIKPAGRYYLNGVSDFIRACGRRPAYWLPASRFDRSGQSNRYSWHNKRNNGTAHFVTTAAGRDGAGKHRKLLLHAQPACGRITSAQKQYRCCI